MEKTMSHTQSAPVSEEEVLAFLRDHRGAIFKKPDIAQGIAEQRVPLLTIKRKQKVADAARELESELQHMRLRDLPKVTCVGSSHA